MRSPRNRIGHYEVISPGGGFDTFTNRDQRSISRGRGGGLNFEICIFLDH